MSDEGNQLVYGDHHTPHDPDLLIEEDHWYRRSITYSKQKDYGSGFVNASNNHVTPDHRHHDYLRSAVDTCHH